MKIKIIFLLVSVFLSARLFSQDQIFKKDNTKLEVKVLEVNPNEVKYKLKSNPDGPLYVISKSDIAVIIYANGEHETFADAKPTTPNIIYIEKPNYYNFDSTRVQRRREIEKNYARVTKYKNMVFVNSLALANSCISLTMAREFLKGKLSVHLPISFSVAEPTIPSSSYSSANYFSIYDYKITQKSIDVGVGIYFHTGKRAVTHFIGPLVRIAQYNGNFKTVDYSQSTIYTQPISYAIPGKYGFVMNETYFMVTNGFLFRITPRFNLMVHAAVGFTVNRTYIVNDPNNFVATGYGTYKYTAFDMINNPVGQIGIHAGFRF